MTREQAEVLIADVMAEHFARLRADLIADMERTFDGAARRLPPFVPPMPWTNARHGAGVMVRHRNGLFCARRDALGEPGADDAWLPLVVGVAAVDLHWDDERTLSMRIELSDGSKVEMSRQIPVPIVRGFWDPESAYQAGDRVFRYGEWLALGGSKAVDPVEQGDEQKWLKVSGKAARGPLFKLNDDGSMLESGHVIGTLKPLVAELFEKLTAAR